MGWEWHGNRRYYYRKHREGKHVVSEYAGTGVVGKASEEVDLIERMTRAGQQRQALLAGESELDALSALADILTQAVLLANGYHAHKRQWRKAR